MKHSDSQSNTQTRVQRGAAVFFGRYPQRTAENTNEPIEWTVLDTDEKAQRALLISRRALDCRRYHRRPGDVAWASCSLRAWLNGVFFRHAFNEEERAVILWTGADPAGRAAGAGFTVRDRVFLLSPAEAGKYFPASTDRTCLPTAYAKANGAEADLKSGACAWWLRGTEGADAQAASADRSGALCRDPVHFVSNAVRPALWMEMEACLSAVRSGPAPAEPVKAWKSDKAWEDALDSLEPGDVVSGTVVKTGRFSARIDLDGGLTGFMPASGLCPDPSADPRDLLQPGQRIRARVLEVDRTDGRVDLGGCALRVFFGRWPHKSADTEPQPIEWIVLEADRAAQKALLISRYALDSRPYHHEDRAVSWKDCSLRAWLNGPFAKTAFSEKERGALLPAFPGGADAFSPPDRVFLFDRTELERYLPLIGTSRCFPTLYAMAKGVSPSSDNLECPWWVRSPVPGRDAVYFSAGSSGLDRPISGTVPCGVRPALWVDLRSAGIGTWKADPFDPREYGIPKVRPGWEWPPDGAIPEIRPLLEKWRRILQDDLSSRREPSLPEEVFLCIVYRGVYYKLRSSFVFRLPHEHCRVIEKRADEIRQDLESAGCDAVFWDSEFIDPPSEI